MTSVRDSILALQDIPSEDVHVPEWNQTIRLRGMTAAELDDFEASCLIDSGDGTGKSKMSLANVRARMVARCAIDENGERIFLDTDAQKLGAKSGRALDRLYDVCNRLNGRSAKDIKDLAKT